MTKLRTATKIYIAGEAGKLCEKHKDDKATFIIELVKIIEAALKWQDTQTNSKVTE